MLGRRLLSAGAAKMLSMDDLDDAAETLSVRGTALYIMLYLWPEDPTDDMDLYTWTQLDGPHWNEVPGKAATYKRLTNKLRELAAQPTAKAPVDPRKGHGRV